MKTEADESFTEIRNESNGIEAFRTLRHPWKVIEGNRRLRNIASDAIFYQKFQPSLAKFTVLMTEISIKLGKSQTK